MTPSVIITVNNGGSNEIIKRDRLQLVGSSALLCFHFLIFWRCFDKTAVYKTVPHIKYGCLLVPELKSKIFFYL